MEGDEVMAATYPEYRGQFMFGGSGFSPDGRYFAFTTGPNFEQAWLYDTELKRLVALTQKPTETSPGLPGVWIADALYLYGGGSWLTVKDGQPTKLSGLPPSVAALIDERRPEEGEQGLGGRAGKYLYDVLRPCRGCPFELWVKGETDAKPVLLGNTNQLIADRDQPLLFEQERGWLNGITILDIRTRRRKFFALPTTGEMALVGAKQVPGGFRVAYTTDDACLPELGPEGSESWYLFNRKEPQEHGTSRICFVKIAVKN
jgi:hypothetical protein